MFQKNWAHVSEPRCAAVPVPGCWEAAASGNRAARTDEETKVPPQPPSAEHELTSSNLAFMNYSVSSIIPLHPVQLDRNTSGIACFFNLKKQHFCMINSTLLGNAITASSLDNVLDISRHRAGNTSRWRNARFSVHLLALPSGPNVCVFSTVAALACLCSGVHSAQFTKRDPEDCLVQSRSHC